MPYTLRLPPSLRPPPHVPPVTPVTADNSPAPSSPTSCPPSSSAPASAEGTRPPGVPAAVVTCLTVFPVPKYEVVSSPARAAQVCAELARHPLLAVDTETYAVDPTAGNKGALSPATSMTRLIQVAAPGGLVVLFDLLALGGLPPALRAILADTTIVKMGFNLRFDGAGLLRHHAAELVNPVDLLAGAVLASGYMDHNRKGAHTLEREVERHLHLRLPKEQATSDWGVPALNRQQLDYAARDVAVLLPLHEQIEAQVGRASVRRAWDIENGAIPSILAMEAAGFSADRAQLEALVARCRADADAAAQRARAALGDTGINLNSPRQLVAAIQAKYGLMVESTSEENLVVHITAAPAIQDILAWRRANSRAKTASGFIEALQPDGRIHARFNPLSAPTGRIGCTNPNLLAVPRDPAFRQCFRAELGSALVVADYSASQLRIIADHTQDPELRRCFTTVPPIDPHIRTASFLMGKPLDGVTSDERKLAKPINFGFAFGMGARRAISYARDTFGVVLTLEQAVRFREAFFQLYPAVRAWHQRVAAECSSVPATRTASGRLRVLQPVNGRPPFTELLNTPIQGTEADGVKRALALLHPRLKVLGAELVNVVHDEVVVRAPVEKAEETKAAVVETLKAGMAEFVASVPIEVEAVVSDSWVKP